MESEYAPCPTSADSKEATSDSARVVTPAALRARRAESEIQLVAAAAVPALRNRSLISAVPKRDPITVTLLAPVTGQFVGMADEPTSPSNERALVVDCNMFAAAVIIRPRVCRVPLATRATRAESAVQRVASLAEPPSRTRALLSAPPAFTPNNVTLVAPVDGELTTKTALTSGLLPEKATSIVP
jgi:hypothetical protein